MAQIIVTSGGSVAAGDSFAFNFCRDGDVLPCWEAEVILRIRQAKAVESSVVRDGDFLDQREFAPLFGAQDRLAAWVTRSRNYQLEESNVSFVE